MPLLPVYAESLGASPRAIGIYLSMTFAAVLLGTIAAGHVADKTHRARGFFVSAGVLSAGSLFLMGIVGSFQLFAVLTGCVWFASGFSVTSLITFAGRSTPTRDRGKIFSALAIPVSLGTLVGGLITGAMVDHWGYRTMFLVLSVFCSLWPLLGCILEQEPRACSGARTKPRATVTTRTTLAFSILLLANTLAWVARFSGRLGTSLVMSDLQFSSMTISMTEAIGGAVSIPLLPLLGRLADFANRKWVLAWCYATGAVGLFLLSRADTQAEFLSAYSLLTFIVYASNGIGPAVVADMLSPHFHGRGNARFVATSSIGGIIGFAAAGQLIQWQGPSMTFYIASGLAFSAMLLICLLRKRPPRDDFA